MLLAQIVALVNQKLAGEILTYDELKVHLDSTIDDINGALDALFPAFTDFTSAAYPTVYPNYNFFPDRFIRTVVVAGAATKFYITDEEGIETAQQYLLEYQQALFIMQRDYSNSVPTEFQASYQGYLRSLTNASTPSESSDYFPEIRYVESANRITDSSWNGSHMIMGVYHFWVDATGKLRIKNGTPTSDLDGNLV